MLKINVKGFPMMSHIIWRDHKAILMKIDCFGFQVAQVDFLAGKDYKIINIITNL